MLQLDRRPESFSDNPLIRALAKCNATRSSIPLLHYFKPYGLAHIPSEFVLDYLNATSQVGLPYQLIHHLPATTTQERAELVQEQIVETVLPVRTVTLEVKPTTGNPKTALLTTVGDFPISKEIKVALTGVLGQSKNAMRDHTSINPSSFDPIQNLRISPGEISPFFLPLFAEVPTVVYLETGISEDTFVGIAIDPEDTAVVAKIQFLGFLKEWYQNRRINDSLKIVDFPPKGSGVFSA